MAKKINGIEVPDICSGYVEYKMSKQMADVILKEAKANKVKKNPQEVLCDFVNTQMGLKGYCVKVIVEIN